MADVNEWIRLFPGTSLGCQLTDARATAAISLNTTLAPVRTKASGFSDAIAKSELAALSEGKMQLSDDITIHRCLMATVIVALLQQQDLWA